MKKIALIFSLLLSLTYVHAQILPTGNLTIFSEDGYKFFLILNGERQNQTAETNIRLEALTQKYYSCKIIFEDKSQKEISKNYLMIADANNQMQDVTYKIKKDRNGKQVLKFFSQMPAMQNIARPNNCTVYRFGGGGMPFDANVSQNNYETIDDYNSGNGGVNIPLKRGGVNTNAQNRRKNDRDNHNNYQQNNHYYQDNNSNQQGCNHSYQMPERKFDEAFVLLRNEGFDDTRLDIAKQIASNNCLHTNQIISLCKLFGFEGSKLEFAKYAYDHCVNPQEYYLINNVFGFSSSKTDLTNYIKGR